MGKKLLFYLFVVPLIVLALIFLAPQGGKPAADISNREVFIHLTGFSMYPTIKEGDVRPCEVADSYSNGDIIAFTKNNNPISHRIVGEFCGKYITKGDNNPFPDFFLVGKDEVICKVIC